jgi:N-acetylneuraminate lyase
VKRTTGLIAASHTPMSEDGSIHLPVIEQLAERFVGQGLAGVFPCGTTGEFPSLTVDERKAIAQRWVDVAKDRLSIIIHVGSTCLPDSQELARHAQEIGATGFGAMGPYFFRPRNVADLVDYVAELAGAAPALPFYYYHIPVISGVDLPMREFLAQAADRVPNLAGLKFTHYDLMDASICADFDGGRFDVLYGFDEQLLPGLISGAVGAVGTTYSFCAPLSVGIFDAFQRGDLEEARRLQLISSKLITVYRGYGGARAMKSVMKMVGIDCGPVRAPLARFSEDEFASMQAELEALGFREYC